MRLIYTILILGLGIAIGSYWVQPSHAKDQFGEGSELEPTVEASSGKRTRSPKSVPSPEISVSTTTLINQPTAMETPSVKVEEKLILAGSDNLDPAIPTTPWQELMGLADEKKWTHLVTFHDKNTFGVDAHSASLWRAKALLQNIKSQGNLISFEQTQKLLQEQLLLTPAHSGIHLSLAEAQFQQGQIQQALNTIEQGANLSQDGATALLSHRDAMVQEHIDFLLENDHWQEVITFVRSEPASASPHYYAHQLAAAHAHAQLFQWREAESLLNMAEFDPDLYTAIHQLRTTIKKGEEHMMLKQQELERKSIIAQHILGNTETDDQGYMKLPFEKDGHAILVPFSIGEHRLRLLFDTGASITMLSSSWIEKTKAHHLAQLDSKIFITAGGRVRSPMIRIQQVQFGPLRFDHVDMAFQDIFEAGSGIDGLLGMNVLKYFEIKFDFSASTLLLKAK